MSVVIPLTRATGMGPLPDLLESRESSKAVTQAFSDAQLPMRLIAERNHLIPLQSLVKLFHQSAQYAGDPIFGLNVGLAMRPQEYGLWLRYSLQAPTLEQGIDRVMRCLVLHQFGGRFKLEARPGAKVAWQYWHKDMASPAAAHHADHVVPVMIQFVRTFLGANWRPDMIEVAYPHTKLNRLREETVGVPWLSGRAGTALVFPKVHLKVRQLADKGACQSTASITSVEVLADHLRAQSKDRHASVEAIVALRLMDGHTDINGVAEAMGIGARSLQRQLARDGRSYRAVLEQVRMNRAAALVTQTEQTLTEIAFEVGYSDPAHFTRAFTRHYGHAPSRLRASP